MLLTMRARNSVPLVYKGFVAQLQPSQLFHRFPRIRSTFVSTSTSASNSRTLPQSPAISRFHDRTQHSNPQQKPTPAISGKMAAPGHHALNKKPQGARSGPRRPSNNSLSLYGHRIDRPDVKAAYIDTHCHLFTTLQMMKEVR